MKFWLGDPDPKFWGRGPLVLGALVREHRVALNAERMVALSVACLLYTSDAADE